MLYIIISLVTFIIMEFVAWATHKYVMHGFLWYLHKDHHQKEPGFLEKNDTFFLIFAVPSWLCIMLGLMYQVYPAVAVGAGIALYGFAYFCVHEIIIHQRIKLFKNSNLFYIKVLRWAHLMHHKHIQKEDGESFGMLIVHKKYWEKVRNNG